jgi:RNA polymerase sigma factor (sigma-70 family)
MEWPGVHELVRQAKGGDKGALEQLYALVQPYLLRLAEQTLGPDWPHKSVSDLTQETWLRAWQGIGGFRGGADDTQTAALLRAWLKRTLRNVCHNDRRFDAARRRRAPGRPLRVDAAGLYDSRGEGVDPPARDATPSANARTAEQQSLIRQALARLPNPADRELVRLRVFEGLLFQEIGARLGCDESTVRYRFQRALQHLGRDLKGLQ